MPIYRVNVTREESTEIFVEADSAAVAEEEALELANSSSNWEDVWDPEASALPLREDQYPVQEDIWTGGEQGHNFQYRRDGDGKLYRVDS